ncbi:MAG: hypothetical protein R3185_02530 [Candidatus Thermoplasmatota archaeon]|nr:hypothetical protein [Candidatus Thermoplasmatota archaeon]
MSDIKLTPGSTYRVVSVTGLNETVENVGEFKGFVGLGNVDTIVLAIEEDGKDEPTIRLVPAHTVRMLDIVEDVTEEEDEDETEYLHYG